MLNRNGKAYLYPAMAATTADPAIKLTDTNTEGSTQFSASAINKIFVRGGSGNTPVTVDDRDLDSPVLTLTEIDNTNTQKGTPRSYEDNFILTVTTTYQNNTGEDVIIRELGLFLFETYASREHMIARILIDPVTVRAGRSYAFTMTIG